MFPDINLALSINPNSSSYTNNGNVTYNVWTTNGIIGQQRQEIEELREAIRELQLSRSDGPVLNAIENGNRMDSSKSNAEPLTGGHQRQEIEELRAAIRELQSSRSDEPALKAIDNAPSTSNFLDLVKFPPKSSKSNGTYWQQCNANGPFPSKMVRAGVDIDGSTIYAGRAFHKGDTLPAKVIPSRNTAYVCYDGKEFEKNNFEVLRDGDFEWQSASKGNVPRNAVKFGTTVDGESLYMGRTMHRGSQTPGKVHPSHSCLYIPFDGKELSFKNYEVLCSK